MLTILAFILPTLVGYAVVRTIDRERQLRGLEITAISFATGSGCLALYMFVIGIIGVGYSFLTLAPFFIGGGVLLVRAIKTNKGEKDPPTRRVNPGGKQNERTGLLRVATYILTLLIIWKVFFVLFNTLSYPTYFDDALSTWDFKAKVIYTLAGLGSKGTAGFLGGSMLHYPPGTALFKAWLGLFTGMWSDRVAHLYPFTLYVAMLALFFSSLRRHVSGLLSLLFCYMLASVPLLTLHASSGYVDFIVGFYLLCSCLMLARWFQTGSDVFLYLTAILAAILAFTKNEGMVLFIPVIVVTFLIFLRFARISKEDKTKKAAILGICLVLFTAPWLAVKIIYGLGFGGIGLEFHPEALSAMLRMFFFDEGSFNVLWAAAIMLLIVNRKHLTNKIFLSYFTPAVLSLLAITAVFVFTSGSQWVELKTTAGRTFLTAVPLLLFSLGTLTGLALNHGEGKTHGVTDLTIILKKIKGKKEY